MWAYGDHMPKMKNVGVREFRDHATKYLAGPRPSPSTGTGG
jgi:hypothetical protein